MIPGDPGTPQGNIDSKTKEISVHPTDAARTEVLRKRPRGFHLHLWRSISSILTQFSSTQCPSKDRTQEKAGAEADRVPKLVFLVAYLTPQRNLVIK
jgi:hypothetical protein